MNDFSIFSKGSKGGWMLEKKRVRECTAHVHISTYTGPVSSCNYDACSANRWAVLERDGLRSLNRALMDLDFSFIWSCTTSSQQQAQLHLQSFRLSPVRSFGGENLFIETSAFFLVCVWGVCEDQRDWSLTDQHCVCVYAVVCLNVSVSEPILKQQPWRDSCWQGPKKGFFPSPVKLLVVFITHG